MRILVLGLDCAAPEILFGDERLASIRRLTRSLAGAAVRGEPTLDQEPLIRERLRGCGYLG